MKKNCAVYPYDEQTEAFVRYSPLLENYSIIKCISPSSWAYNDEKISSCNGDIIKIVNHEDLASIIGYEALWIVESNQVLDFQSYILPFLKKTISNITEVIITRRLTPEESYSLRLLCDKCNVKLHFVYDFEHAPDFSLKLLKINTPIVFILGVFENTEKLDTTLYLRNEFIFEGYKVETIISQINAGSLLGCRSFPSFMFDFSYSDTDKIYMFNRYVKKLEIENNPDIIVIGVPGEILPINYKHCGNFGLMPYLVSNAVSPDYAVLTLIYGEFLPKYLEEMRLLCKYKFNVPVEAFSISTKGVDFSTIDSDYSELKYYKVNDTTRPKEVPEECYYNKINGNGDALSSDILSKLQDYGRYCII